MTADVREAVVAHIPLRGDLIVAGVVGELQGWVGTVHLLKRGLKIDTAVASLRADAPSGHSRSRY